MHTFGNRPMKLFLDEIEVSETRRPLDPDAVSRLAESIKEFGLQHPISVISRNDGFRLVAGRHRLEAYRKLGLDSIETHCVEMDDRDARMWEIGENLHRADLTTEQRYEQIAEYARLAKEKREAEKPVAARHVPGGRGNEGGDSLASRDLGLTRTVVIEAQKYADLPKDVKEKAIKEGISVRSLLRKPVSPSDPPRNDIELTHAQHKALVSAWERAGQEARERFLTDIGAVIDHPIMDQRFS